MFVKGPDFRTTFALAYYFAQIVRRGLLRNELVKHLLFQSDRPESSGGPIWAPIHMHALNAVGEGRGLSQRLAGACLSPQSASWPAIPSDCGAVPIGVMEGAVVLGSHPCWQ